MILRGNSGSGKTAVARALQGRGARGQRAVVSQDVVRREVLWTWDVAGNPAIELIDLMVRYLLEAGMSVIVEGILHPDRYAEMLIQLAREHRGTTCSYFWNIPFAETLRRHATKDKAAEFGEAEMREWWYGAAVVPDLNEVSIGPEWSLEATVERIESDCGWI